MDGVPASLNEALRIKPNYATALNNRGIVWSEKGEHNKAIMNFERILLIDPNNHMAIQNMAIAIKRKKRRRVVARAGLVARTRDVRQHWRGLGYQSKEIPCSSADAVLP